MHIDVKLQHTIRNTSLRKYIRYYGIASRVLCFNKYVTLRLPNHYYKRNAYSCRITTIRTIYFIEWQHLFSFASVKYDLDIHKALTVGNL